MYARLTLANWASLAEIMSWLKDTFWMLICLYSFVLQVVNEPTDVHCPVVEMATRSKLSCLSWNKFTKNHIASSDYEGIVTVWDVARRQVDVGNISTTIYICLYRRKKKKKIHSQDWYWLSYFCNLTNSSSSSTKKNLGLSRVLWNMRSMKNVHGVLIFPERNHRCLCPVVTIAR